MQEESLAGPSASGRWRLNTFSQLQWNGGLCRTDGLRFAFDGVKFRSIDGDRQLQQQGFILDGDKRGSMLSQRCKVEETLGGKILSCGSPQLPFG